MYVLLQKYMMLQEDQMLQDDNTCMCCYKRIYDAAPGELNFHIMKRVLR